MVNNVSNPSEKKYDLIERTSQFGEKIIDFSQKFTVNHVSKPLVSQLVRSGTSIGANYMEADAAESKKDFEHKIAICRKEAKETMYWLRMLAKINDIQKKSCRILWKEAQEFVFIFSAILKKSKSKI